MKKRNVIKFLLVMQLSMVLTGCGKIDIQIPEEGITVELGSELPEEISEYVTAEKYENISINTEEVDTSVVGTYSVSVYYKKKEAGTLTVAVVDTTAPEAKVEENVRVKNGQKCVVDDYVKEIADLSETEAWFMVDSLQTQNGPDVELNFNESNLSKRVNASEDGKYQINVLVRDIHDNYNVYPFLFEVYTPDTEAPVITAKDKSVEFGKTPDYMAGVSATDNADGDLTEKIEVDTSKVNVNKAGKYTITYSVSDEAGNQGTKESIITVKEKKVQKAESTQTAVTPVYQVTGNTPSSTCPETEDNAAATVAPERNQDDSNNQDAAVIVQPEQQAPEPTPEPPVIPETPVVTAEFDTGKADELLALVNAERQARGIGAVSVKDSLVEKAKEKAQSGSGSGSGVILCRGTGATSASIVIDSWNKDWPDGTWMTEAWKYAGAACYNDGGTYTWVVVFGAY